MFWIKFLRPSADLCVRLACCSLPASSNGLKELVRQRAPSFVRQSFCLPRLLFLSVQIVDQFDPPLGQRLARDIIALHVECGADVLQEIRWIGPHGMPVAGSSQIGALGHAFVAFGNLKHAEPGLRVGHTLGDRQRFLSASEPVSSVVNGR
jgi:hypothetical protein